MAYKTKNIQDELREFIAAAVADRIYTPQGIRDYLMDNGWKHDIPSTPTIEKLLKLNGVGFGWSYRHNKDHE